MEAIFFRVHQPNINGVWISKERVVRFSFLINHKNAFYTHLPGIMYVRWRCRVAFFLKISRKCLNQTCGWISLAFVISLRLICFRPFIFPEFHGCKSIGKGESLSRNRSFTISTRLDVFFRLLRFRFQGKNLLSRMKIALSANLSF